MEKCLRCKEKESINVMMPFGEITENGRVIYPNETEEQSLQVPVPLCFKCMAFAREGWINLIKKPNSKEFFLIEINDNKSGMGLKFFEERYKLGELEKDIKESLRECNKNKKQIKNQRMKNTPLRIAIIVYEIMEVYNKKTKENE